MAGGTFILFAGDESWRIVSRGASDELRVEREAGAGEIALAAAAKLRARGYQGEGVLLALPAPWCLSAVISTADLPRQDRAAMAFRLEEKLPLAAEHFTADFVVFGENALGICVGNEKVRPLVEALERAGVVVASVSPAAMLAAQQMVGDTARVAEQLLVWGEAGQVNVISVKDGRPIAWGLTQAEAGPLNMAVELALMELGDNAAVVGFELPHSASAALEESGHTVSMRRDRMDDCVARLAGEILSGAVSPWFELRRGAMAVEDPLRAVRRPVNAVLVAAAVLCFVLAMVFWVRSIRYDHLAASYERSLAEEFQKEFPGIALPMNPQATLLSEKKRLVQAGSSALPAQAQESALRVMRDVLGHIPAGANLAMDHLTFNDTSLELMGKSRANEDVDALVTAARSAGMEVPPPQMRKDAAGHWSFTVRGSKPARAPRPEGRQ
jgi:hypothetical protein